MTAVYRNRHNLILETTSPLSCLTRRLVVLQCDDVARSLLQALEEVDHQVADVLRVGTGEGELLAAHRGQSERLLLRLVGPGEDVGISLNSRRLSLLGNSSSSFAFFRQPYEYLTYSRNNEEQVLFLIVSKWLRPIHHPMCLLLAGDLCDFGEAELEEDLLLVVHHVHAGPVDGDDDVVLRQVRT